MNDSPILNKPGLITPVAPEIEDYLHGLTTNAGLEVPCEMEALAAKNRFPIVGRLAGIFLETLTKAINAKHVFEFGSGYGYSAFWFARAMGRDGKVVCTDGDPENQVNARRFLTEAGLWENIEFHVGNAQKIFNLSRNHFDICYNDADKGDYPEIWMMAKDRIRSGGLYIADNVLWHGRVVLDHYEDIVPGWTEAIRRHNHLIFNDPEFDVFINPTRDGVLVARRK